MNHYQLKIQPSHSVKEALVETWTRTIDITDESGSFAKRFLLMCAAITDDIQNPQGSGAAALKAIQKVESGESTQEELGGNAWSTYITPHKVWFEGYYNQGEGGEVSLAQYKLAVQTYVQFLSDPEQKCIEVAFPAE
jgi:hypothetical protein